jgi:hypothetical protein
MLQQILEHPARLLLPAAGAQQLGIAQRRLGAGVILADRGIFLERFVEIALALERAGL